MPFFPKDASREEQWHLENGCLHQQHMANKLRHCERNDWIRLKIDLKPLLWRLRGEIFAKLKMQSGEHLMLVYVHPMRALESIPIKQVFIDASLYLKDKCDTYIQWEHLAFSFPPNAPVDQQYSLLDIFFACVLLEEEAGPFQDGGKILQLHLTTSPPIPSLQLCGECFLVGL